MNKELDPRFIEMKEYLESIGGLVNGWYIDRPPIVDPHFMSIDLGWYPLVLDLIKNIVALGWDKEICQIKQKFAGLRFYTNGITDEISRLIDKAESKSFKTCEKCGNDGKSRNIDGWYTTLCDKCYEQN